ncbi:hypothetical protein C2S52_011180 [Perilla frutescens var. hirtella]|nr:hypothetical protein C2S52_011180 [Perilla frutescens var. hirtella]KAH6786124.1 hypothetical protein C2S51_038579 [Perilla frutescens var. frutescens]
MRHDQEAVLAVLMGAKRNCLSIWINMVFAIMMFKHVEALQNYSRDSLNYFLHDYALGTIFRPRTGKLYEVSPPANFSDARVSFLRLRSHSLWKNGANLSSVEIPAMALPLPFTRRVDLVYQNLGNWSTSYYNVPSYTFVAPVIGLLAYDSNAAAGSTGLQLVELDIRGDSPIMVRFDNVSFHQYDDVRLQCVRFASNGTLAEFTNVTGGSSCVTRNQGHFSIVVPRVLREKKKKAMKWWMVGIPAGVILIAVLGIFLCCKMCRWRTVRKMENISERSEGLNTIWIGNSRMPSASGIRTQPNLENSYIP